MDRRTFNRILALSGAGSALKAKSALASLSGNPHAAPLPNAPRDFAPSRSSTRSRIASTESQRICIPASFTISAFPRLIGGGAWNSFGKRAEIVLATYIPWYLHEPEEGKIVFGGESGVLDFEAFLRTAQDVGLYVIARPGPYQYTEMKYDGLPGWLCENYPELHAQRYRRQIVPNLLRLLRSSAFPGEGAEMV